MALFSVTLCLKFYVDGYIAHFSHAKHVALNLFLSSACTKRFIKITQNHILQNQSSDNHAVKQTFSLTTLRFS